jgi:hypothetical protein
LVAEYYFFWDFTLKWVSAGFEGNGFSHFGVFFSVKSDILAQEKKLKKLFPSKPGDTY